MLLLDCVGAWLLLSCVLGDDEAEGSMLYRGHGVLGKGASVEVGRGVWDKSSVESAMDDISNMVAVSRGWRVQCERALGRMGSSVDI